MVHGNGAVTLAPIELGIGNHLEWLCLFVGSAEIVDDRLNERRDVLAESNPAVPTAELVAPGMIEVSRRA